MRRLEHLKNKYKDNPVGFVEAMFGCELQPWQKEALEAIVNHDRIAMRSGHGVGKTTFLSWTIFWWLGTRHPSKIACTAPTSNQLRDVLWPELCKWHNQMDKDFRDLFVITNDRVALSEGSKETFAVARTARRDQPEALQGFHSENMLFIVDEASGVDEVIFQVGAGSMTTPGSKTILTGNPTRASGRFYNCFHRNSKNWYKLHVPSLASTKVDNAFIQDIEDNYGKDSNIYKVRVLGEFPKEDDDTIIPLYLCENAVDRDVEKKPDHPVIWGVDVARFGNDKTALAKRQGNFLLEPVKTWSNKSTTEVAAIIKEEFENTPEKDRPQEIMIDVIGFGAGVYDILFDGFYPVRAVNVAESPSIQGRYGRLRDELWFKVRQWLQAQDVKLPRDDYLIGELTLPRFSFDYGGKMIVEKKEDMRSRGVTSPDRADALCLTFASTARMDPGRRRFEKKLADDRTFMSE